MTGVPQTQAQLIAAFPLTGGAGLWGAQQLQNLVVSSMPLVVVTNYGADATGVADSTTAFQNAMSAGQVVLVPPGIYALNGCIMPSGAVIVGLSAQPYQESIGSVPVRPILKAATTTTANILIVDNASDITIDGMLIDGSGATGATCNGISAGSTRMTLRDVTVQFCSGFGMGGAYAPGSNVENTAQGRFYNCGFMSCTNGVGNMIDGWIFGCSIAANTTGCRWDSGFSGALHVIGTRIEWNQGDGCLITDDNTTPGGVSYYGNKIIFSGCSFDRNYIDGLYLNTAANIVISGCAFTRNGRNLDSNSCHIRFNNAVRVMITGCTSTYGKDDDETGNVAPAVWARFAGTSSFIIFNGNDMTGYSTTNSNTAWRAGTVPTTGYIVSKNFGTGTAAQDIDTR